MTFYHVDSASTRTLQRHFKLCVSIIQKQKGLFTNTGIWNNIDENNITFDQWKEVCYKLERAANIHYTRNLNSMPNIPFKRGLEPYNQRVPDHYYPKKYVFINRSGQLVIEGKASTRIDPYEGRVMGLDFGVTFDVVTYQEVSQKPP